MLDVDVIANPGDVPAKIYANLNCVSSIIRLPGNIIKLMETDI